MRSRSWIEHVGAGLCLSLGIAATSVGMEDAARRQFCESSDLQPDVTAAITEAHQRLQRRLADVLDPTERSPMTDESLRRRVASWLLKANDVRLDEEREMVRRPYGTLWRCQLVVTVPQQTLDAWAGTWNRDRKAHQHTVRLYRGYSGAVVFVSVVLAALADRLTHGYRRGLLGIALGLILTITGAVLLVTLRW